MLNHIDCVPSNVQLSHQEALLYVFEDNEAVTRPPPKISLKHEWKRELGSEHAQLLHPIRERSGRPAIRDDTRTVQDGRKTSRFQEIDVNSFH